MRKTTEPDPNADDKASDSSASPKLDFGRIQKEVQKVRKQLERKHGLEVAETASHIVHTATKMCVLGAITNKVDPAEVLLSVIEMFKAIERSSDVLAGITPSRIQPRREAS